MDSKESSYEQLRRENIQRNEEEFKKLFPEVLLRSPKVVYKTKRRSEPLKRECLNISPRTSLKRNCKSSWKRQREQSSDEDTFEEEDKEETSPEDTSNVMVIKFPRWGKRFKKNIESTDNSDGEEYTEIRSPRKRRTGAAYRPFDAVCEEDLVLVAERTSEKQYDQVNGTSCHQCRQKTDDLKTICRSGRCIGVRGQFCGPCLKNRYGECAKEAIMNPEWECPSCRGICNCSFCMKKRGRRATGILIHHAKQSGYDNVSSFLGLSEK